MGVYVIWEEREAVISTITDVLKENGVKYDVKRFEDQVVITEEEGFTITVYSLAKREVDIPRRRTIEILYLHNVQPHDDWLSQQIVAKLFARFHPSNIRW